MAIRRVILVAAFLSIASAAMAAPPVDETKLPSTYIPSGKQTFSQYCATCHGSSAKGNGPLASMLKTQPADLTTLAKRHGGKFPYEYVTKILEFGPGAAGHGTSEMPTWGPIFRYFNKDDQRAVEQRVKNLCDYLASLQRP